MFGIKVGKLAITQQPTRPASGTCDHVALHTQ
jgi:hypothetical protein